MQLIKPVYARLGSPQLLQKCVEGYTQNANEALHSTVWKLCPKELFLGKKSVDITCAIAVSKFNDGASSLLSLSKRCELSSSRFCKHLLRKRDKQRIQKSRYKTSEHGKPSERGRERDARGSMTRRRRGRDQCMCLEGLMTSLDQVHNTQNKPKVVREHFVHVDVFAVYLILFCAVSQLHHL